MRWRTIVWAVVLLTGCVTFATARWPRDLYPGLYSAPGVEAVIEVEAGGTVWMEVYGQRRSLGRLSVGDSYAYDTETTVVTPVRRREWRYYPGIGFSETAYYENVISTIVTTYTIRAEWNEIFQVPVFGIYENNRHQHTLMTPWARFLDDTGAPMPAHVTRPFDGGMINLYIDVDPAAYWWLSVPEWCRADSHGGRGPRTVALEVLDNSGADRDAVIILHHESGPRATWTLQQAGRPIFIRSAVQLAGRRALKVEYGVPVSSEVSVKIRNDAEVLTTGENVEGALGNVGPGERHELVWTPDFEGEGMLWTNMTVELTARNAAETNAIFGPLRFDGRTLRLRVVSAVDGVQPPAGLHEYFWGALETCEAPAYHGAVADGRVLVCDGWRGLGSVPAAGDGTQTIVAVTNLYSEISWRWRTNTAFTVGRPQMVFDGGDRLDVVYDLHDPEDRPHAVTLAWRPSDRGEWLPCLNATGATGVAVLPGDRNVLRWYFGDAWSNYTGKAEFRLHVTDGIFEDYLSVGAWTNRPHALDGLTAQQRVGTKRVDVEFDIRDPDPFGLPVRMEYSLDGLIWKTCTQPDAGHGAVFPGRAALVWDAAADCDLYTGQVFLRITVDDGEFHASESVGLNVDFADATLLIVSPFGAAVPPPGPNLFPVNASVRCHVETPVEHGGTWYVCRGWIGDGSVPASGNMADTGEFVLSEPDNSLTWLWETLEIADVSARQLPGTRLVEIDFDVRSPYGDTMRIEVAAEADGETIDLRGLSGASGGVAAVPGRYTLTWDAGEDWPLRHGRMAILVRVSDTLNRVHATVDVEVDTRDYVLNVVSALPDCDPAPGIHRLPWGTSIVCQAPERVETAAGAVRLAGASLMADDASFYPVWLSSTENEIALTAQETVLHWHWRAAAPETPVLEIAQIPGRKTLRAVVQRAGGVPDVAVPMQVMLLDTNIPLLPVSLPAALTDPLVAGETGSVEIELADLIEDGTYGRLAFRVGGALRAYPESVDADVVLVEAGINTGVDPDGMAYECALTEPLMVSRYETRVIELAEAVNWGLLEGWLTVRSNQVVTAFSTAPLWRFDATGPLALSNGFVYVAKGFDQYPAAHMTWYGAACYANLRSLMEGFEPAYDWDDWRRIPAVNGYRLPSASEWEYLYRGGLRDKRFPWGNHVTHENVNYHSWGTLHTI